MAAFGRLQGPKEIDVRLFSDTKSAMVDRYSADGITTIDNLDGITLSDAAPEFKKSLGIGKVDYFYIVNAFQLAFLDIIGVAFLWSLLREPMHYAEEK